MVMAVSDQTRGWIVEQARQAARAKVRERAMSRAYGEEVVDDRRAEVVRRRILRILSDGPASHGTVHSRIGKREYKELFPSVIASLLATGDVMEEETQRGKRYSIADGVRVDPGVKVDNSRSSALTPGVRVDPGATVTDIDTHRLRPSDAPPLTARQWLDYYISGLLAAGKSTAESFAVYEAGKAAGHPVEALRSAASAHPDVTVIKRTARGSIWDITGSESKYLPAGAWVQKYITGLPDGTTEIDRGGFRAAAEEAGYTWTAVRHAALNHARVQSAPAEGDSTVKRIWILKPPADAGDGVSA